MEHILEDANKYLAVVREIVKRSEPDLRLEVGFQSGADANLHYKVFRGMERLSDVEVFSHIPSDRKEAESFIADAFEMYKSFAEVLG